MQRHTKAVDGEILAWYEGGDPDGVPVVLIHGIPTGPELWRKVVPLVGGARCLAFEMLGYAESILEGRGHDISVAGQANRLWRWLDGIGVDRVVLVGHDLGGGVAQIAAVNAPSRCSGLVLTNTIAYDSWPIPSVKIMRAGSRVLGHLPHSVFRPMLSAFVRTGHGDRAVGSESARVHWGPYGAHGGAAAFVRQIRSLHTDDTRAVAHQLPALGVPSRIVWGAADRFQKIRYGERLARDLGAPLVRLDGAKHFVPEDHPEPLARAIGELLTVAQSSK